MRTSEEAARLRPGYSLKQGAKAIIVRVKQSKAKKFFVMLVLPGDLRFDIKKVKGVLFCQGYSLCDEGRSGEHYKRRRSWWRVSCLGIFLTCLCILIRSSLGKKILCSTLGIGDCQLQCDPKISGSWFSRR
ncbi:hypothetical protein IH980_00095 [Patescibacteria group bacterium]|nr:hypothetical protein [Patescibacteria group bacterium]